MIGFINKVLIAVFLKSDRVSFGNCLCIVCRLAEPITPVWPVGSLETRVTDWQSAPSTQQLQK